jgi:hypothetical protein
MKPSWEPPLSLTEGNRIENLRLLCPNCNSQADTFAGRKRVHEKKLRFCLDCVAPVSKQALRCRSCTGKHREPTKIDWPPMEQLRQMAANHGFLATGRSLGVSDNAIRKHMRVRGEQAVSPFKTGPRGHK